MCETVSGTDALPRTLLLRLLLTLPLTFLTFHVGLFFHAHTFDHTQAYTLTQSAGGRDFLVLIACFRYCPSVFGDLRWNHSVSASASR